MSDVVRVDAGRQAVRAYVAEQASRGLAHVLSLLRNDKQRIERLTGDLSEDEAMTVTPADEWCAFDVLRHLANSLERSRERIETLCSGRPFVNPGGGPGQMGTREYASFAGLRRTYIESVGGIIALLQQADAGRGLELTSEHAQFGPFNWLEWAVYTHHVHVHDHLGQLEKIRGGLRRPLD